MAEIYLVNVIRNIYTARIIIELIDHIIIDMLTSTNNKIYFF